MSLPRVVAVASGSPAARAGLQPGDQIVAMDGQLPRDVIEYQLLADQARLELDVRRGGMDLTVVVVREGGVPLGMEVDAALFDRVRTCDNHCEFCFIHQLPKGLRHSLYTRDDDYRLSFLYGNFTTLTRFTEIDLERVVTEGLSPLWVSIHATDPEVRQRMLRNRRAWSISLRWLRALLDEGIVVHGQVVVCPGVNDGAVLDDTIAGVMDRYPEMASLACVPLGISKFNTEGAMRPHTPAEAAAVVDLVEEWQEAFVVTVGHRMVHASDEFYLQAGRPLPPLSAYGDLAQHENGVGLARGFEAQFRGVAEVASGGPSGFFRSVDGAPAEGYRAPRTNGTVTLLPRKDAPVTIITGEYAASFIESLAREVRPDTEVVAVPNHYFGGNTAVAGLLTGGDIAATLADARPGRRYLIPDVCLSGGMFLDGVALTDLPVPVEVVPADGAALRQALCGDAA